jgi:HPr kinase/phosphorylase
MTANLTMRGFFERLRDALTLSQVEGTDGLDRQVRSPNISSPGLVLAGYTTRFPSNRIQVLGETEMTYLASLSAQERRNILKIFFGFPIPGAIITKGQAPSLEMVEEARQAGVALLVTTLKTNDFYSKCKPWLEEEFAPSTNLHGACRRVRRRPAVRRAERDRQVGVRSRSRRARSPARRRRPGDGEAPRHRRPDRPRP